jgi:autotransporter-associated beta strand protein
MKPSRKNPLLPAFPLATAFAALVVTHSAHAGNTWDGGGLDSNWLTPANWDFDVVVASPTPLTFVGNIQNSTNNNFTATPLFEGLLFLNSGAESTSNAFTLTGGSITLVGNIVTAANTEGATITDLISLNMILSGNRTITTNQLSAEVQHNLTVNGIMSEDAPTRTLTKAGAGTLTLGGVNTYTGNTIIGEGKLIFSTENALTGGLTFGTTSGSANPGSLDLSANTTFAGPFVVQTNTATANTITIGAGKTLATNGDVTIGTNSGVGRITNLTVSGTTGSWIIANTNFSGKFQVGGAAGTTNTNPTTLDLSGLGTFNANLSGFSSTFRVGGANTAPTESLAILKLAATSTITANTLGVGDVSGEGTPAKLLSLGTGVNTINANEIRIANAINQRSSGTIDFQHPSNGSLIIRSQLGTEAAANLSMVKTNNAGANNHTARLLLAGHNADVSLNAIVMASRSSGTAGSGTAEITFDTGTFSANTIAMTGRTGTTVNGPATGTITIGGGTASLGAVTMAVNTNTNAATGLATADLNINNGTVTASTINMANAVATGSIKTATANINLAGGSLTLVSDITRTGGGGTENATITLKGGTLNMAGNDIGTGSAAIALIAQSGTLQNVATINDTGGLTKTTAGTLTLTGTNTYTGATIVSEGTLALVGGSQSSPITVNAPASLGFTLGSGTTSTGTVTFDATSTVRITGSPAPAASYTLLTTTATITGTPVLSPAIPGFGLQVVGSNTLKLVPAVAGVGYSSWALLNATTTTPAQDQDGDGVNNAVEYVLGGTGSTNDRSKLPAISTAGGNLRFTFQRAQASIDGSTTVTFEVGTTLLTWPDTFSVPGPAQAIVPGVTITKDTSPGFDTVTLSIPQTPDARKFARLRVVAAP